MVRKIRRTLRGKRRAARAVKTRIKKKELSRVRPPAEDPAHAPSKMTRCAALVRDILVLLVIDVSSQHNRPGPRSPVAGWTGTHAGIFCSPIFCSLWCRGFRKGTKTMDKYRYSGSVKPSRKSFSVRCMLPSIESIRQGIEGIPERPSRISDFDRGLTTPSISSAPSSSVLTEHA